MSENEKSADRSSGLEWFGLNEQPGDGQIQTPGVTLPERLYVSLLARSGVGESESICLVWLSPAEARRYAALLVECADRAERPNV